LAATTYRWVDADGIHFSDQPHPGAEKVTLSQPQTYASAPVAAPTAAARPAAAAVPARGPFRYASCGVVQPANEEVLFSPEAVVLRAQTTPTLRPGDRVSLLYDGSPVEASSPGQLEYRLTMPERGSHTVAMWVRDANDQSLCQSPPITFHVRVPSQLAPLNPNNPNRKH
jgi:hypothetical protein